MNSDRWNQVQALFEAALEVDKAGREAFLKKATDMDDELLREVMSLLEADETGHSLLDAVGIEAITPIEIASPEGQRIGNYRIIRQIGSGGMGAVYLAERADGEFDQQVALKLIKRGMDSEEILGRFHSERQILARLQHPNIAQLFDGGISDDGLSYFTLEYVDGIPIDVYCNSHRLTIEDRLRLFRSVCEAVQYAQENLVVHRDLKPSNILVTSDGSVKLLDFGIAKVLVGSSREVEARLLTQTGLRVMTPQYASPEQIRSEPVTTATDVYSLGVILYELLTGHRPYRLAGYAIQDIEAAVCSIEPEKPSSVVLKPVPRGKGVTQTLEPPDEVSEARSTQPKKLRRRLSGDLDTICLKALKKEPHRRYSSAGDLLGDVNRYLAGQPIKARPDTLRYRTRKFVARHRASVAFSALIVAVIVSLVAFYTTKLTQERDRARTEAAKAAQVASFLTGIFELVDPAQTEGEKVTARELLDRGAARLDNELAEQPEIQATVMNVVGNVYMSLGLFESARPLFERSLHIRESLTGDNSREIAEGHRNMAIFFYENGDYATAEGYYSEALDRGRAIFGEKDPFVASILNDLASSLRHQGKYDSAEVVYHEALVLRKESLGEEHTDVAHSLNHLGRLYHNMGRIDEAEPLLRQALVMRRKLLHKSHPEVMASVGALAALLREKGQYSEAKKLYDEAFAAFEHTYGLQHPYTAGIVNNLALTYCSLGDYEKSEELHRQALELHKQVYPPGHHKISYPYIGLGAVYSAQGEYVEAESMYRQALELTEPNFAADHPRIAEIKSLLGGCLCELGRFEEAERVLLESYTSQKETYSNKDKRTRDTLQRLVELYTDWDKPDEAATYQSLL